MFDYAETEYLRRSQSTNKREQCQILFEHCRAGVSKTKSKIRKVERRSKHSCLIMPRRSIFGAAKVRISESNVKFYLNIAEREYLRRITAWRRLRRAGRSLRRLRPANTPAVDPRVGIPAEFLLRMTIANRHPGPNVEKHGWQPLFFPAIEPKTATTQTRRKIRHAMCRMKPERTSGG